MNYYFGVANLTDIAQAQLAPDTGDDVQPGLASALLAQVRAALGAGLRAGRRCAGRPPSCVHGVQRRCGVLRRGAVTTLLCLPDAP